jgi:hypothetical protein
MNSNPDSGIENTRGESATEKWPMGWMRSFREKISSNRLVSKSWSLPIQSQQTSRRQLNSEEPLTQPALPNQPINKLIAKLTKFDQINLTQEATRK